MFIYFQLMKIVFVICAFDICLLDMVKSTRNHVSAAVLFFTTTVAFGNVSFGVVCFFFFQGRVVGEHKEVDQEVG